MSNEIKDHETVHSDIETDEGHGEPITSVNHEEITTEISIEDNHDTLLPNSTADNPEIPLETSMTDVTLEEKEEEDSTPIIASSNDIPSTLSTTSDEDSNNNNNHTPVDTVETKEETIPVDTVHLQSSDQPDDTPPLLRTIADKSNKEASTTILNTVRSSLPFF